MISSCDPFRANGPSSTSHLPRSEARAPANDEDFETAAGPALVRFDIGHCEYEALIEADTAFWALARKDRSEELLRDPAFLAKVAESSSLFSQEMNHLRFGLVPSAVYVNPTERCNLDCTYCYIPGQMRRHGSHMSRAKLVEALETLLEFFHEKMPRQDKPQLIFHGSEPMLNRANLFEVIDEFRDDYIFGIQTNGTLLDAEAIEFITSRGISLGLSLDGPTPEITDRTRHTFSGHGIHERVVEALERLRGYKNYSVIATVTTENLNHLSEIVELFHSLEVPTCMLNQVRCTLPGGDRVRPEDQLFFSAYLSALERSYELYQESGRKLVVANFANVILGVVAPTARRLMCDISPCGGGRCFFAVSAGGDLFPCSEFIGLKEFSGGNLFSGGLGSCFETEAFRSVTGRMIEEISECGSCPIRHFCGAPCPAEAHERNGGLNERGAFCDFYKEQVRYVMRLIADGRENDFLWDGWDQEMPTVFELTMD